MKLNLVSWNVRGLNNLKKRRIVKSLVTNWKADIICFLETKLDGEIKDIVSQIWGGRRVRYACLEASGTRWGIMMLWDCKVWKTEMLQTGAYTLTCKFEAFLQNFACHIISLCS